MDTRITRRKKRAHVDSRLLASVSSVTLCLLDNFYALLTSQGHNFYKLKYISLEEVKIAPFQQ